MSKSEPIEASVNEFLNENYDGRYRSSVDKSRDEVLLYVAFEEGSEKPGYREVAEMLSQETGVTGKAEAGYSQDEGIYYVAISDQS
ncbi:MAG: hypothetical protein ABEJ95_05425 [Candidatus Nanohalobium sp.]